MTSSLICTAKLDELWYTDIDTPKYTVMYTVAIYAIFHHMEDLQVHVALARNTYFDEVWSGCKNCL